MRSTGVQWPVKMNSNYVLHSVLLVALLPMGLPAQVHSSPRQDMGFADKAMSDDLIYDNVKRRLAENSDVKGGGLDIDVKDGVVTLRGKLETQRQIDKAAKVAKKVNGVKRVVNEIQLPTNK
jgi:hyperosmotically inducible protein